MHIECAAYIERAAHIEDPLRIYIERAWAETIVSTQALMNYFFSLNRKMATMQLTNSR